MYSNGLTTCGTILAVSCSPFVLVPPNRTLRAVVRGIPVVVPAPIGTLQTFGCCRVHFAARLARVQGAVRVARVRLSGRAAARRRRRRRANAAVVVGRPPCHEGVSWSNRAAMRCLPYCGSCVCVCNAAHFCYKSGGCSAESFDGPLGHTLHPQFELVLLGVGEQLGLELGVEKGSLSCVIERQYIRGE